MTTPTACRALSARIQAGDKTVTNGEIALALGWRQQPHRSYGELWHGPKGEQHFYPRIYLTSVDATRAEWPEGWRITIEQNPDHWRATAYSVQPIPGHPPNTETPTEPAARAALLLEIRAVDLESMG